MHKTSTYQSPHAPPPRHIANTCRARVWWGGGGGKGDGWWWGRRGLYIRRNAPRSYFHIQKRCTLLESPTRMVKNGSEINSISFSPEKGEAEFFLSLLSGTRLESSSRQGLVVRVFFSSGAKVGFFSFCEEGCNFVLGVCPGRGFLPPTGRTWLNTC